MSKFSNLEEATPTLCTSYRQGGSNYKPADSNSSDGNKQNGAADGTNGEVGGNSPPKKNNNDMTNNQSEEEENHFLTEDEVENIQTTSNCLHMPNNYTERACGYTKQENYHPSKHTNAYLK